MQSLETSRLVIRPLHETDLADLADLYGDPAVMQYITGKPRSFQETHARLRHYRADLARCDFGLCAILLKPTGQFIGRAGIAPADGPSAVEGELAWMLFPAFWGQGLACEAASTLVEYAWQNLALNRLFATSDQQNLASIRVMQKLGMRFVRTYARGEDAIGVEYELLRE